MKNLIALRYLKDTAYSLLKQREHSQWLFDEHKRTCDKATESLATIDNEIIQIKKAIALLESDNG